MTTAPGVDGATSRPSAAMTGACDPERQLRRGRAPYYADESVTLWHGDCLTVTAWLDADVLVTDPPYGIGYKGVTAKVSVLNDHDFSTTAAALALSEQPMAVFASHASLLNTMLAVGHRHSRVRVATWHKTNVNLAGAGNPWMSDVEFVVCGVPEWPKIKASGVLPARRFTGNPASNSSPDAYLHPTQKNVRVMEMVLQLMPPGVIADPFAGSGSTLIAARNLGRRAIGVEVDERYCEVIAKRLSQGVLL